MADDNKIHTMADDLAGTENLQPEEPASPEGEEQDFEAQPPSSTQFNTHSEIQRSTQDLDELLPLEDTEQKPEYLAGGPNQTPAQDELREEIFPQPQVNKRVLPGSEVAAPPANLPTGGQEEGVNVPQFRPQETEGDAQNEEMETPENLLGEELEEPSKQSFDETMPPPAPPQAPSKDLNYTPEEGLKGRFHVNLGRRTMFIGAVGGGAIIVALVLFLIIGGGNKLEPIPQIQQPAVGEEEVAETPTAFTAPVPLVLPDFEQEIILNDLKLETMTEAISSIKNQDYPAQTITYLPMRLRQLTTQNEPQYLSAQIFLSSLGLNTPNGLSDAINPIFMLYAYGSGDEEKTRCEEAKITDKSCYGPRLGLVLKAKEGQAGTLNTLAAQWRAMSNANLDKLIISDSKQVPASITYNSAQFRGLDGQKTPITAYYSNMPISAMALNFAVADDLLVVATSKNANFFMLDKILSK